MATALCSYGDKTKFQIYQIGDVFFLQTSERLEVGGSVYNHERSINYSCPPVNSRDASYDFIQAVTRN